MKKSIFIIGLLLFTSLLFSLTIDEVKLRPYKKTSFYGDSFSRELLEKVRPLEGNAKQFLSDYDNYYEYKTHELTTQEKIFLQNIFLVFLQNFRTVFWITFMPFIL